MQREKKKSSWTWGLFGFCPVFCSRMGLWRVCQDQHSAGWECCVGATGQPAAFPWPCLAGQTFLAETSPCSLTLPSRPLFLLSTCCIGCHSVLLIAGMFWLSCQQPHLPGGTLRAPWGSWCSWKQLCINGGFAQSKHHRKINQHHCVVQLNNQTHNVPPFTSPRPGSANLDNDQAREMDSAHTPLPPALMTKGTVVARSH